MQYIQNAHGKKHVGCLLFPAKQKCKSSNMGIVVSLFVCKNSRDGIGKKFFIGENSDENCMITRRNISLLNRIHEALYTRYRDYFMESACVRDFHTSW